MSGDRATLTFFFTDIEGSTRLWAGQPEAMARALARHDAIMRRSIEERGGRVFKTIGDAFCAAFEAASSAVRAALEAQHALQAEDWGEIGAICVRMALHTGEAELRDADYFGPPLNRVARLLSTAHGGQTILSQTTFDLVRDALPAQASLQDFGEHRLKDLERPEHVYGLLHPGLRANFPPLRSLSGLPNNLPQQVTSFVGRQKETPEIERLLRASRLLTLTGAGGTGKTRLALQVAADVLEEHPEGTWFVELASVSDPGLVPQTVAAALGVREEPGKPITETLLAYLRDKRLLLVLDNCEHLLDAIARVADAILRGCPHLRILATSREAMGIAGEQTYRVPSLASPDPKGQHTPESLSQYDAVRLFIDRALLAQPSFAVTNDNAPAIAQLCHRLDGIPFAIELAAARVRAMPVDKITERLDDRFRLLTGGSRTALPRQQTLRAMIDWSYDLLSEKEKTLLRRLSVFAGGWTLEAAEAVCADRE